MRDASVGEILRVDVVDHKLLENLSHWGLGHCAKNKLRSRLSLPLKLCIYLHAVQLHNVTVLYTA